MSKVQQIGEVLEPFSSARIPIKAADRVPGEIPYLGASGVVDYVEGFTHNGCYLCVAEDGANLLTRSLPIAWIQEGKFWANNHLHVLGGVSKSRLKYFQYAIELSNVASFVTGSAQPKLNQASLMRIEVPAFGLTTEEAIGAVLGSLDDKIAANSNAIEKALLLQSAVWIEGTKGVGSVLLGNVSEPILGGTPPRKDEASWGGGYKWASVADMTASPRSHLLNTAETITSLAIEKRRFAPLPAGSVLLSARGTVGRVVSLVEPSSFNQSAYGFKVTPGFEAAFRLAVTSAVDELRAKSYGSVFSTITKTQINEASVPAVFETADLPLHHQLNSIESLIVALEKENVTLAKTRDELLPLLMNGKISVREAKQEATSAGADIPSEEIGA
ncbi:restriction endonuclease subunit S [Brevibacterium ravenspurgense]|uniref:restriction endonuclease subunit S n=1 Tax=Brevibacterium ravenspurgense TaxID=479117 RepID=UPI0002D59DD1|nr:restriction endonuclease subunit S [Brevibacterium ravenspurgense]